MKSKRTRGDNLTKKKRADFIDELFEHYKKNFIEENDSYAFWGVIEIGYLFRFEYPDWVRDELYRISKKILKLKNPNKSYPEYIAKILNLNGHMRRSREKELRDSTIRRLCLNRIKKEIPRKNAVFELSNMFGLNERRN